VGLLGKLLRFLIWVLVATWIGRKLFGWLFAAEQQSASTRAGQPEGRRLFRDPVCGTHVPAEISLKVNDSGQTYHFCSAQCRDQYLASVRQQASA
jgi:YHS domain-containing protein